MLRASLRVRILLLPLPPSDLRCLAKKRLPASSPFVDPASIPGLTLTPGSLDWKINCLPNQASMPEASKIGARLAFPCLMLFVPVCPCQNRGNLSGSRGFRQVSWTQGDFIGPPRDSSICQLQDSAEDWRWHLPALSTRPHAGLVHVLPVRHNPSRALVHAAGVVGSQSEAERSPPCAKPGSGVEAKSVNRTRLDSPRLDRYGFIDGKR